MATPVRLPHGYVAGLDWLKTIGIVLIVQGHVAPSTVEWLAPPFYAKQIGVALFVFATGFTLAREWRATRHALFNRLFEIMVVGLAGAVTMSTIGLARVGDINESNYLPLMGLHLLVGDLPANPTTWYLGTYLHLLLIWAVAFRWRPLVWRDWVLAVVCDVLVRCGLLLFAGPYRAYMAVFNWLDVLILGLIAGRSRSVPTPKWRAAAALVPLAWPVALNAVGWRPTFPFMTPVDFSFVMGSLVLSLAVWAGYSAYVWAAWTLVRPFGAPAWVRYVARNTPFVVVAHMPVYYGLEHLLLGVPFAVRATVEFAICLIGLAVISEWLRSITGLDAWKVRLGQRLGWHSQEFMTPPGVRTN